MYVSKFKPGEKQNKTKIATQRGVDTTHSQSCASLNVSVFEKLLAYKVKDLGGGGGHQPIKRNKF